MCAGSRERVPALWAAFLSFVLSYSSASATVSRSARTLSRRAGQRADSCLRPRGPRCLAQSGQGAWSGRGRLGLSAPAQVAQQRQEVPQRARWGCPELRAPSLRRVDTRPALPWAQQPRAAHSPPACATRLRRPPGCATSCRPDSPGEESRAQRGEGTSSRTHSADAAGQTPRDVLQKTCTSVTRAGLLTCCSGPRAWAPHSRATVRDRRGRERTRTHPRAPAAQLRSPCCPGPWR